jgi:hypothetical protein
MRFVSANMAAAKKELAESLRGLPLSEGDRAVVAKRIASFTAAAVREDRVHRHTHDALAKLANVFAAGPTA